MIDYEVKFKSGALVVTCKLLGASYGRSYFHFKTYLVNEKTKESILFDDGPYDCPVFWEEKKIAQDLIGWMVDTHETLYDFVDTDEERSTDNETIYSGVFI